ncbi:hypothetical protein D3C86_1585960 [compost metagenome]
MDTFTDALKSLRDRLIAKHIQLHATNVSLVGYVPGGHLQRHRFANATCGINRLTGRMYQLRRHHRHRVTGEISQGRTFGVRMHISRGYGLFCRNPLAPSC